MGPDLEKDPGERQTLVRRRIVHIESNQLGARNMLVEIGYQVLEIGADAICGPGSRPPRTRFSDPLFS